MLVSVGFEDLMLVQGFEHLVLHVLLGFEHLAVLHVLLGVEHLEPIVLHMLLGFEHLVLHVLLGFKHLEPILLHVRLGFQHLVLHVLLGFEPLEPIVLHVLLGFEHPGIEDIVLVRSFEQAIALMGFAKHLLHLTGFGHCILLMHGCSAGIVLLTVLQHLPRLAGPGAPRPACILCFVLGFEHLRPFSCWAPCTSASSCWPGLLPPPRCDRRGAVGGRDKGA